MEFKEIAPREAFYRIVECKIKEHLSEDYQNAEVSCKKVDKMTESYMGMMVRRPSDMAAPTINMDACYEAYRASEDITEILDMIADQITTSLPDGLKDVLDLDMTNFEAVKNKLHIRLGNAEGKDELLENIPHRYVADMVVTYHVTVDSASVTINNSLLESYGMTEPELYANALDNSQNILPASIENLGIKLFGREDGITLVSNLYGTFGAAAILYPEILDDLSNGGKIYILPSSVHEVLVVDGSEDLEKLHDTVLSANSSVVEARDKLSDHVYAYEDGKITIAA